MRGPQVLLIADEYYASLAAVRALRRAGYVPIVGTTTPDGYAHRSGAAAAAVRLPPPSAGEDFVAAVAALARDRGVALVLPGTEAAVVALAGRDDDVAPAVLGAPPPDVVQRVTDKSKLAEAAAAAGITSPSGIVVENGDLDGTAIAFPAVLKPVRSAVSSNGRTVDLPAAVRVDSADELRGHIGRSPDVTWLVQPFLQGRLVAVAGVSARGETICTVHQEARRIYPVDCGVSAFAETVPIEQALDARVRRLLELVELTGIWEAQFIADDSTHYLIDFNPRMYGSLGLAVAAGANLPALLADVLLGKPRRPCTYRHGVHFRSEMRDLGVLAAALQRRDVRRVFEVLTPRRRTTHAVLSLRDPRPALLLVQRIATRARG